MIRFIFQLVGLGHLYPYIIALVSLSIWTLLHNIDPNNGISFSYHLGRSLMLKLQNQKMINSVWCSFIQPYLVIDLRLAITLLQSFLDGLSAQPLSLRRLGSGSGSGSESDAGFFEKMDNFMDDNSPVSEEQEYLSPLETLPESKKALLNHQQVKKEISAILKEDHLDSDSDPDEMIESISGLEILHGDEKPEILQEDEESELGEITLDIIQEVDDPGIFHTDDLKDLVGHEKNQNIPLNSETPTLLTSSIMSGFVDSPDEKSDSDSEEPQDQDSEEMTLAELTRDEKSSSDSMESSNKKESSVLVMSDETDSDPKNHNQEELENNKEEVVEEEFIVEKRDGVIYIVPRNEIQ